MRFVLVLVTVLCGCAGDARTYYADLDNGAAKVESTASLNGASFRVAPGGSLKITGAHGRQPMAAKGSATAEISTGDRVSDAHAASGDAASTLQSLAGSFWYMIAGAVIAIAGGVVIAAKRSGSPWATPIPRGSGRVLIIGGSIMAVLPYFLEAWGWLIPIAVVAVIIPFVIKYYLNFKKESNHD